MRREQRGPRSLLLVLACQPAGCSASENDFALSRLRLLLSQRRRFVIQLCAFVRRGGDKALAATPRHARAHNSLSSFWRSVAPVPCTTGSPPSCGRALLKFQHCSQTTLRLNNTNPPPAVFVAETETRNMCPKYNVAGRWGKTKYVARTCARGHVVQLQQNASGKYWTQSHPDRSL